MEQVSSETPLENMQPQKPPDSADQSKEESSQNQSKENSSQSKEKSRQDATDKASDGENPSHQSSSSVKGGPEKITENVEEQPAARSLVEPGEEMIQIHEKDFFEDDRIFKEDGENQVEETHTEIDLTNVDLETQRLAGMCRVCAKSRGKLYPVFGTEKNITEKIHTFLPILVTPDDLLPVTICNRCLASLEQSQRLVQICLEADKKLRDLLESKLTESVEVEMKSEKEDVDDNYDEDYCVGCNDDEPNRPPTPLSPSTTNPTPVPIEMVSPKREITTPEPMPLSTPKTRTKSADNSTVQPNKKPVIRLRNELARLESDLVMRREPGKDSKTPNILGKRKTRQSVQESLSPTILEKMRSYGIKESSVVMTKVDIPEDSKTAVVTTVSVPITKDKPKSKSGPRRLYRCLYCSETGSDAYKLLLHQMKMHPGNLLKCPHCGFVCGSDQKAKYDAHVLAHTAQIKAQPAKKIPGLVAIASNQSVQTRPINGPEQNMDVPAPGDVPQVTISLKNGAQPKSSNKPKSLLKGPQRAVNRAVPITPKNLAKGPVQIATPVVSQIPGSAIMLRIQVDGKPGGEGTIPAPAALVPVTLYQCARCRLNFNTKEGVEKHICVIQPNLIPIAPKPGDVNFPCPTCGYNFTDSALLREHLLTHMQTFKCTVCDTSFRSEFHLKQHSKKHNPPEKKEFACPQCPKVYTVKSRLLVHIHTHSNTPRCVCPQCGKVFRTDGGYRNHVKAHENHRAFACSVCGLRFNRRGNMRRHERNCDGKKFLCCKYCTEKFDQKDDLLKHRTAAHPDLEFNDPIPDVSTGDRQKRYTCKVCSEGFVRVMDMRRHQLLHSDQELAEVKNVPDGGAYLCHTCGKQIHHKHNYKLHMMHHQGRALFRCDQCDRTFTSKFALNYHHMLHTGDFPFKCSVCNESFRTGVALQVHRYKHTGEKPYRCKSCEMGFFTTHSLRLHQIVHSTERNYVCKVCGSTFKRRKTLRYHSLIHTGEKPHQCRICGKSFRQKGTCTIHERNHQVAATKPKPNAGKKRRLRLQEAEEIDMENEIEEEEEGVIMEGVVLEDDIEEELEDEKAAQMVEMEIEDQEEAEIETVQEEEQPQQQIWRLADPKLLKNIGWKNPTTSQVNEAIYVLRETDETKGQPEGSPVQTEVIGSELLSMYPEMQIQDSEIIQGEKATIEFTTPDGTIRIIR